MMNNLYSIGEVAKIKEVTIKALRYYHKMGILIPAYTDKLTGYRYYSIEQFIYIDIIKICRTLGTSIIELQEIFERCDTNTLYKFLELKKLEAEANINKMQQVIQNINILNTSIKSARQLIDYGEIVIQYFEERYLYIVPCKEVGDLKEVLYYSELDRYIQQKELEASPERGIVYGINEKGDVEPQYVFNGIKGKLKDKTNLRILPKGRYLTLAYSTDNEEVCIEKLFNYIREKELEVKELIEVELLNDLFNTKSYSCQIQMYIEENKNMDSK